MNKQLTIIPGFADANMLPALKKPGNDFLAFTPAAMLLLDRVNLPYITPADLYGRHAFTKKIYPLHRETENILETIDDICEESFSVASAYKGNVLYFVKLFTNLIYLEGISRVVKDRYEQVRLLDHAIPEKIEWGALTFKQMQSLPMAYGLANKVRLLNHLLKPEVISGTLPVSGKVPNYVKVKAFLYNTPERLLRGLREKRIPFPNGAPRLFENNRFRKKLAVVQDGYEVGYLRKFLAKEFEFISPTKGLRQKVSQLEPVEYDFSKIQPALQGFLESNFPGLKEPVEGLFKSYHREVVGRVGFFKQQIRAITQTTRPAGLLFSAGTRDVVENITARVANKSNIPLFCFQHGGTSIFFNSPYQDYIETNEQVEKVLFLNAKAEEKHAQHGTSRCIVTGSPSKYQNIRKAGKPFRDRVLYCSGPLPFYSYNGMLTNVSDTRWYQITSEILLSCHYAGVGVDIKLHPIEQAYGYNFFKALTAKIDNENAGIIYGIPAESVAARYNLIIMDFVASAIFPFLVALKTPIILWQQDMGMLNPLTISDVKERCHLVGDGDALRQLLRQYCNGQLETKWSQQTIDRYVYPIGKGNPGRRIAACIKSICAENKTTAH